MGRTLPDDTQAAILLSLFDPPTLRKLRDRATETRKELADLSFDEVKSLLTKVLKIQNPSAVSDLLHLLSAKTPNTL